MQLLQSQKPKNQFAALSPEDRQQILNLCSQHPYEEVAAILRKPRAEGGLEIDTSRSALSRFYTNASHETSVTVLAQVAAAANIRHEQNSNAFIGAIRATVEEGPDYLVVHPLTRWRAAAIRTYDDHRVAMCFSLAALGGVALRINDPRCVAKTFPEYFEVLAGIAETAA